MIHILENQRPSMFTGQKSLCRGLWRRVCTSLVCTSLHMTLLRLCMHVAGRASVSLRAPRVVPSFQRHRTPALRLHPQPPAMKLAMVASFEDIVAAAGTSPLQHSQIGAKPRRREGGGYARDWPLLHVLHPPWGELWRGKGSERGRQGGGGREGGRERDSSISALCTHMYAAD